MIQAIIRFLTYADFFNIYKPAGTENLGGGQSYIDFPTRVVSLKDWEEFFDEVPGVRTSTQEMVSGFTQINWFVPIVSDGDTSASVQEVKIYRRRSTSVSIASQKITSSENNRVRAWLPQNGFPSPRDSEERQERPDSLCIVLYRFDNTIHAGWRLPSTGEGSDLGGLTDLISFIDEIYQELEEKQDTDSGYATYLKIQETPIDITIQLPENNESDNIDDYFLDEDSVNLDDLADVEDQSKTQQDRIVKYRKRNKKIVTKLKDLYNGECQVSGTQHTFLLKKGQYYSEAHHLIPLGKGGSDNAANIVIVSPTVHRMLHSIKPVTVDFSLLHDNQLPITVGGKSITVIYNEKHAELVNKLLDATDETSSSQS